MALMFRDLNVASQKDLSGTGPQDLYNTIPIFSGYRNSNYSYFCSYSLQMEAAVSPETLVPARNIIQSVRQLISRLLLYFVLLCLFYNYFSEFGVETAHNFEQAPG